jgi:hypothetical protein
MSMITGIAAGLCLFALGAMVFHNLDWTEYVIYYGRSIRKYVVLLTGAFTLLVAAAAIGFGFNSAGQRRNTRPRESWLGFFLGAGVICFALVLLFIFRERSVFVGR